MARVKITEKVRNIFTALAVGLLFFAAFSLLNTENINCVPDNAHGVAVEITFTDEGATPSCVIATSGETITWVNNSSYLVDVGADPHPVHTGNREVSAGEFVLTLNPGERKSVIVTEIGTFGYHDHAKPSAFGIIIVR